ncbi:hypothetical protein KJ554_05395 [bacterium]|nr:hypothetical protein [bacterium]
MKPMTIGPTLILAALILPAFASAVTITFDFTADFTDMADHWPDLDGWVGTADDLIDGGLSPVNGSAPNPGTYAYNAFDFDSGLTDDGMPAGYNAITFITGSPEVDLDVARGLSPLEPLFTELHVTSGTEPFFGHGPFTAQFTNITAGDYDPSTGAMTLTTDFSADLNGSEDTSLGLTITGEAWVIEDGDYGTATGHAYLDDVVIPLAQAADATRVLYVKGSGIIPVAEGFSWGQMPFVACIVALDDSNVSQESSTWGGVKALYGAR